MASTEDVDGRQKQSDRKFDLWVQKKSIRDKSLDLLSKLEKHRASEDKSCFELTIALRAAERLVTTAESENRENDEEQEQRTKSNADRKNALKIAWLKVVQDEHHFTDVVLTDAEYDEFSGAVKEFLDEGTGDNKGKFVRSSLKYSRPAPPKPGMVQKGLTNDQKLQNKIFMKKCTEMWKDAQKELERRVDEFVSRRGDFDITSARPIETSDKAEEKGTDSKESSGAKGSDSKATGSGPNKKKTFSSNPKTLERAALMALSLKRMQAWIDEDEDEKMIDDRNKEFSKRAEAKQQFESWVKQKDDLRIRLPPSEIVNLEQRRKALSSGSDGSSRMSFRRDMNSTRQISAGMSSSAELMMGSGLRYVHAIPVKSGGPNKDLEKSKKLVLEMGFLSKENCKDREEWGASRQELRAIQEKHIKEAQEKAREAERTKGCKPMPFDQWAELKDMRNQAVRLIKLVDPPKLSAGYDVSSSTTSMRRSTTGKIRDEDRDEISRALDIGKALKLVDARLLDEWASWGKNLLSYNACSVLWDNFDPFVESKI